MKAVAISIICRCVAYVAVLAFVFGLVWISGNYSYLWFVFLLLTCTLVPIIEEREITNNGTDRENEQS